MLNISDYLSSASIWTGLSHYVREHRSADRYDLPESFTDDELLKLLKKNAKIALQDREYDAFRKAVTALRKGSACSLRKENLYRLFFVLGLEADTQAQDLLLNYLHFNELSARSMEEFILITALKLGFSWEETCEIRSACQQKIDVQANAPQLLQEGATAEFYYSIIRDRIRSRGDLLAFLDHPENLSFFARTCNTHYLALFDDVELETIYTASGEQMIRLLTDYGNSEKETMMEYYFSLFGLQLPDSDDVLSEDEIVRLSEKFEDVFMSYQNFCLLVQRKRPVDISSGVFLLGLLKKLLTEDADTEHDFYVNFLDPDELWDIIGDILIYFGFPVLNPDCDPFDRLLMDVYDETLREHPNVTNSEFQRLYITSLRHYLRLIAMA